jgi:hypothetical protein
MGAMSPKKPLCCTPAIGTTIFFVNRGFCGYLDGPWGGLVGSEVDLATWRGPVRWVLFRSGWLGVF